MRTSLHGNREAAPAVTLKSQYPAIKACLAAEDVNILPSRRNPSPLIDCSCVDKTQNFFANLSELS